MKQFECPPELENILRRRWVPMSYVVETLKNEGCTQRWQYYLVDRWIKSCGARVYRIRPRQKAWLTLSKKPAPVEGMRAWEEWLSVPAYWRKKHPIGHIEDPHDYVHAMLLGALAYQGDETAAFSFERLRIAAQDALPRLVPRGRGNPLDLYCYGERKAKLLEREKGK